MTSTLPSSFQMRYACLWSIHSPTFRSILPPCLNLVGKVRDGSPRIVIALRYGKIKLPLMGFSMRVNARDKTNFRIWGTACQLSAYMNEVDLRIVLNRFLGIHKSL